MASNRGYNSLASSSRLRLVEAASDLLATEGYLAISARRIADRAGLKPQLVHYYFRSMEELVVAVFHRSVVSYRRLHDQALASTHPLRALWQLNRHLPEAKRMTEYIALGKQYPILRDEMRASGENFRRIQVEAMERIFADRRISGMVISPAALAILMSSIARNLVIEGESGMSGAHAELEELVERLLDSFDPLVDLPDETAPRQAKSFGLTA
jgi:AcrR family transcriptional regulator